MNHDSKHILIGADRHPSAELLRQYQQGLLSPAQSHQVERHLLECELCADMVEGMALSGEAQTTAAVADIKHRLADKRKKRRAAYLYDNWRAVAAVFILLCSAVVVVYYQYATLQPGSETIAAEKTESIVTESSISFAPPAPIVHEEVVEEAKPAQPDNRKQMAFTPPVVVAEVTSEAADNEVILYDEDETKALAEVIVTESKPIADIRFETDSVSRVAAAKQKVQSTAAAPQMNLERTLQGQVAGVALQRRSGSNVVQGTVKDENGNPLPGVTVQVKGTMVGAATDRNGNFSIQLPDDKNVLTFRYIGFQTLEQQIDSSTNALAINLQVDSKSLSEVVVTGMGKQRSAPVPEKSAAPSIGTRAYKLYLKNSQRALQNTGSGKVVVKFTVTETGQLQNVRVVRSLNPKADAEAIRLVQEGPAWQPATRNGEPFAQQVRLMVRFNR